MRSRIDRFVAAALVAALLLAACAPSGAEQDPQAIGSDAIAESAGGRDTPREVRKLTPQVCAALDLAVSSAIPFSQVEITGLDAGPELDWGMLVAEVVGAADLAAPGAVSTGADAEVHLPVDTGADRALVVVPPHPSGDVDGGVLQLRLGQLDADPAEDDTAPEDLWCEQTLELTVAPLPPAAPGTDAAALLAGLEDQLAAVAGLLDVEVAALIDADLTDLPVEVATLAVAVQLLEGPGGLRAQLAALDPAERDLADRLLSQHYPGHQRVPAGPDALALGQDGGSHLAVAAPVDGPAAQANVVRAGVNVPLAGGTDDTPAPSPTSAPLARPVQAGSAAAPAAQCQDIGLDRLAVLLGRQLSGETLTSGRTGGFVDLTMSIAGMPLLNRVFGVAALAALLTRFVGELLAGTLPATMIAAGADATPRVLNEDDLRGGRVEELRMTFASRGFDPRPLLIQLVVTLASDRIGARLKRQLRNRADYSVVVAEAGSELFDLELAGVLSNTLDTLAPEVTAAAPELLSDDWYLELLLDVLLWAVAVEAERQVVDAPGELSAGLAIAPACWEVAARELANDPLVSIVYDGAIERAGTDDTYEAAAVGVGTAEITAELPIGQHVLGFVPADVRTAVVPLVEVVEVEVRAIDPRWLPPRVQVRAGERVVLRLEVHHADDTSVVLTEADGQLEEFAQVGSGLQWTYDVPADWDGTPIELVATSLSDRGLRDPAHPAYGGIRRGVVVLTPDRLPLFILPQRSCVEPTERVELRAADAALGGQEVPVVWETTAGSVSASGVLTPPEAGEVTVTATAIDDPERTTTMTFQVGGCTACSWQAVVDGVQVPGATTRWEGERIEFLDYDWSDGSVGRIILGRDGGELPSVPSIAPAEEARFSASGGAASSVHGRAMAPVLESWPSDHHDHGRTSTADGIKDALFGYTRPDWRLTLEQHGPFEDEVSEFMRVHGTVTGRVLVARDVIGPEGGAPWGTARLEADHTHGEVRIEFQGELRPSSVVGSVDGGRNTARITRRHEHTAFCGPTDDWLVIPPLPSLP